jgi:uncharacterized protein YdaU (DUF1376 family)
MCKAFRFMSLDWRDLFDEIDDLSLGAQLAVVKLIGKGWHRGVPLPDDDAKIARMLAVQVRTWLKIRAEIEGLFDLSEGTWNHHQFKRARQHAECRAKAGSRPQTPENSPKVCDFPDHKPSETNNRSAHKNKDKAIDPLRSIAGPDVHAHAVPKQPLPVLLDDSPKGEPPAIPKISRAPGHAGRRSRMIGPQPPPTSPTPCREATTMPSSHEKPSHLQIITPLAGRDSPISAQPGGAGLSASAISSLVDGANLQALLPPSLRAACRSRLVRRLMDEDEEYGPDYEVAEFELVGVIDEAELAAGRAIVAAALQPSAEAVVARELTRLRFATASREFNTADMAMIAAVYAETLSTYPEDIVVKICRDWPRRQKFWPALAELVEPAERLLVERRSLAEALARGPKRPREPDPMEEQRRRAAIEAQERRYVEAEAYRGAHPELMGGADYKPSPLGPQSVETKPPRRWRAEDSGEQNGGKPSGTGQ